MKLSFIKNKLFIINKKKPLFFGHPYPAPRRRGQHSKGEAVVPPPPHLFFYSGADPPLLKVPITFNYPPPLQYCRVGKDGAALLRLKP